MYIYTEEEIRKADRTAEENGLTGNTLMETAGRGLFSAVKELVGRDQTILILSGPGNNGGDGIVLARYLKLNGYTADLVFPVGPPRSETAKEHFRYYKSLGFQAETTIPEKTYDVIIDALLGVGTRLPLRNDYENVVLWCNEQQALRIAVDLPTGVLADNGRTETAFRADYTFSLHGYKPSAFLSPSRDYYGEVRRIDIGLPHDSRWRMWTAEDVRRTLARRHEASHKGTFGFGLLVAGTDEMPGCAFLAGQGAMKTGIGKLMIATTPFVAKTVVPRLPEATYWHNGLEKLAAGEWPEGISAVAIGPGLTDVELVERALGRLWDRNVPVILDAGVLQKRDYPEREAPVIITPHPGEFSRLTGIPVAEIQKNRIELAKKYAEEHSVTVVLKGANTVIAFPDSTGYVNPTGNAALAKGGTGDTLTGMILGFVCSGKNVREAVANAVYLHGLAADEWVKTNDERTLLAGELTDLFGQMMYELTR